MCLTEPDFSISAVGTVELSTKAQILPTRERGQHDPVTLAAGSIADSRGQISQPFRVVDILAAMERRGAISGRERDAGERFRECFRRAQLDGLRATDLESPLACGRTEPAHATIAAREETWLTIRCLGGPASMAGSCLWHVVGLDETLKDWAVRHGCSAEVGSGVLRAALAVIAGPEQ